MSFERDHNRTDAAEAAIERLLATPAAVPPAGNCLDAETAAAWAERRLLPNELAAVETHVADCPRCQELIAVIVQTTPSREAADTAPLVTRWRFGWLVPLSAAAAAVVLWVAVGRDGTPMLQERTAQQYNAAPPAAVEPPPPVGNDRALADKADTATADASARDALAASSALQKSTQPETRQDSADSAASRAKAAAEVESVPAQTAMAPAARPAPAAPATSSRAAPSRTDALMRAASAPIEIVSTDGAVRWRVVPAAIQRSVDGGTTWTPVAVDPAVTITAGASPAPSVCWFVGRAGVVMLTVDGGVTWRRLPFPATTDLIAVRAASAQAATASAADGRQFETTNAGSSWR